MNSDFIKEAELLKRYELTSGPESMIPALKRVAKRCAENPALEEWAVKQAEALFEGEKGINIESWPIPEKTLGDDVGAFNMAVALASVPLVAETHRQYGMDESQLAKTFSWFKPMIALYAKRHGVPGITHTRTFWFRNHVDGKLWRFGNMEFLRGPVPSFLPEEFKASLAEDDEVPTFHFPGGEDGLNVEKIKSAFREAVAFWKRAFGRYPKAFACDSWLFNPAWQELIPDSRIAHSIDIFERLPSLPYNPEEPSGLFFVYDKERCDPRDYPAVNSLEKAFVTLYERGEKPVDGCAYVKVDESGEVLFNDATGAD